MRYLAIFHNLQVMLEAEVRKGGFLAMNKETGELALFRPSEFDKPNIKKKIRDVKKAIKLDKHLKDVIIQNQKVVLAI